MTPIIKNREEANQVKICGKNYAEGTILKVRTFTKKELKQRGWRYKCGQMLYEYEKDGRYEICGVNEWGKTFVIRVDGSDMPDVVNPTNEIDVVPIIVMKKVLANLGKTVSVPVKSLNDFDGVKIHPDGSAQVGCRVITKAETLKIFKALAKVHGYELC